VKEPQLDSALKRIPTLQELGRSALFRRDLRFVV
jgi:hypothetical protein